MSTTPGSPEPGYPQDAPLPPTPSVPTPAHPPAHPPVPTPAVEYRDPPGGPNWSLVLSGLLVLAVAGLLLAHLLAGVDLGWARSHAPLVLIAVGGTFAVVGLLGMVGRRPSH
ncbi:hypothetical protein [Lapillicoccus jejuensis]|uniref:Uncharacterized protein n=1 Tax=Lapillicoccus jejuensis TaxID=402171 RepID=A0A542E1Z6_9MICO|nr:hypothetical protein [Lapillicoccus jejuensis]TQJ09356.1 hypothetical protein FB458_2467 [Lapillicoccus jejuensis]